MTTRPGVPERPGTPGNAEVAERLGEIADLLDLLGEKFKPEAYRRAARSIEGLPESLSAIAARGELRGIPGVGEAIAEKVEELLRTGTLAYLDRLHEQIPPGVVDLMRLPGVGPKTARRFWVELGVDGPKALADALAAGRLVGVKGFAERKIAQLSAAVASAPGASGARARIEEVWPLARRILEALRSVASVREIAVAGSFRRGRETVGDLDVLVTSDAPDSVFDRFSGLPEVREIRLRGPTKETVVLTSDLQVDLRVVEPVAFGAALQYFTGSKDHNVRLRTLARERGLKINEYGVFRGDERIGGRTEEEVYAALGLAWIPPELREDRGEIAAAAVGPLPRLVEAPDLVAEPHVHLPPAATPADVDRLAAAAAARGVRAVGIVVAGRRDGAPGWAVPPGVLDRIRAGRRAPVRLVPVWEIEGSAGSPPAFSPSAGGFAVLVPGPGPAGDPAAWYRQAAPALVAHVGGTAEQVAPALELARRLRAAIEVGPGPDRLDSVGARLAREAGLALSLPVGLGEPDDSAVPGVALGFARRAGATREEVLNSRELPGPTPGAPAGAAPRERRRAPPRS